MVRHLLLALATLPILVACGDAASTAGSERPVTGQVALSAYTLDNPVVVAYGEDGKVFVAPVSASGAFKLKLVSGHKFRLVLASTRRDGSYQLVSELTWGAEKKHWGVVPNGEASLVLGTIRPVGATIATKSGGGSGSSWGETSTSGGDDKSGSGSGGGDDESRSESSDDKSSGSESESEAESEACYAPGKADLPYDVRPGVGMTFQLNDAFLLKGAPPKKVLSVTMEGGSWRLAELQAGTPFVITQADCDHPGNKDTGRDRIFVTWENADGSTETDHLDMRYCKGGGGDRGTFPVTAPKAKSGDVACGSGEVQVCSTGGGGGHPSDCDNGGLEPTEGPEASHPACAGGAGAGGAGAGGSGAGGADPSAAGGSDPSAAGAAPGGTGAGGADTGVGGTPAGSTGAAPPGGSLAGGAAASAGAGTGGFGAACVVNADCIASLSCFSSVCTTPLR